MAKSGWMKYPPGEVAIRTGCKVSWRTYATKAEAERCAKAARHNAVDLAAMGYDFGYQMPGSISKVTLGYEVVLP